LAKRTILIPVFDFKNRTTGVNYVADFGDFPLSNAYSLSHIYENIGSCFVELLLSTKQ